MALNCRPFLALLCLFWLCSAVFAQSRPQNEAPILWADGISQESELDAYQDAGFNTVVVRLPWLPSPTGEIEAFGLEKSKEFAQTAARRGLKVIYALPASPRGFERSVKVSAESQAYGTLWSNWSQGAVRALSDTPNLQGWMLPDDPRGLPIYDDVGFVRWVKRNYANVAILNRQWGAAYNALEDVSLGDVAAIGARFRAPSALGPLNYYEATGQSAAPLGNLAFHPATLALATYKWEAYRALVEMWVSEIRRADGEKHLIFSGQMPDYAQIMSQPPGVDVILPSVVPGVAENDIVTHNSQAIDMARRGGAFGALPVFSLQESAILPREAIADLLPRWIEVACARGARGAGFNHWDALKNDIALLGALTASLKKMSAPPYASLWGTDPVATTAVLVVPLADGATVRFPTPYSSVLGGGAPRGLYGFAEDLVAGEPSNLVWAMRWGTAFGSIDYLSPEELDASVERYTTILAPQLLHCPLDLGAKLANYVFAGGTLVADLGLGALQNGGQANSIPPQMAQLFGVPGGFEIRPTTFNLSGVGQHPLLPTWSRTIGIRNGLTLTQGDGPAATAFGGPVGFSVVPTQAQTLAIGPQLPTMTGSSRALMRASLTIHSVGRGYAVFAPFRLWQFWRPGYNGFNEFHGDLMARGAALAVRTNAVVPQPMNQPEGQTLFTEVINRAQSVTFVNHDAPGMPTKFTSVETTGTGDWLWEGVVAHFSNSSGAVLSAGRPAPIPLPEPFEERPRPLALFGGAAAGESVVARIIPIAVQNLQGGPLAATPKNVTSTTLEVHAWPNAMPPVPTENGWQPVPGVASPFRITVYDSQNGYRIAPNSKHRAIATDFSKPNKKGEFASETKIFTADGRGKLVVESGGSAVQVKISPAP